jgi:hypothetical protein
MVRGLDVFKKYFEAFPDNYVIIGGTACDIVIADAGLTARATKDIDIILVIEALTADFVKQFWKFITDGKYERKEKSDDGRKYYRFIKPENPDFPYQVELFSRNPDLDLEQGAHLTPIPLDDDLSSLSAILLSDTYYQYMVEHSEMKDRLRHAKIEALICLKAKAFLEITARLKNGGTEDSKHLKKHKGDVFRLVVLLAPADVFEVPAEIKEHLYAFAESVAGDLPDKAIFENMGLGNTDPQKVFDQFMTSFQLIGNQ